MTCRSETLDDQSEIFKVNQLAFGRDTEANLVEALRSNPKAYIRDLSIVAWIGTQIVGHIMFTRIHIKSKNGTVHESLALGPMAVRPDHQKQGIGGLLIQEGIARSRHLGYGSVVVLGHPSYYPRFGFRPAYLWGITSPFDVPPEAFMAIELVRGELDKVSGEVEYPREFMEL